MTMYKKGDKEFDPTPLRRHLLTPEETGEVKSPHDPVVDALNALAANVAALVLALDAYVQQRKAE